MKAVQNTLFGRGDGRKAFAKNVSNFVKTGTMVEKGDKDLEVFDTAGAYKYPAWGAPLSTSNRDV